MSELDFLEDEMHQIERKINEADKELEMCKNRIEAVKDVLFDQHERLRQRAQAIKAGESK